MSNAWQSRYLKEDTPWDSGLVCLDLREFVGTLSSGRRRAIELGCGTGTNSLFLAQLGWNVTAIDVAPAAIAQLQQRARLAGLSVQALVQDLRKLVPAEPFDLLVDRGCYHCLEREGQGSDYLRVAAGLVSSGGNAWVVTGSCDSLSPGGPPRLTATQLLQAWEADWQLLQLRRIYLVDAGGVPGPRGWAAHFCRR